MQLANVQNAYAFVVNKKANKFEIRKAIEQLYSVKVKDVRTMNRSGKIRRRGRTLGKTSSWKKAVIVLHEDHKIDLY